MNASYPSRAVGNPWHIHPDRQFFSLPVLGKSNMGGSPKLAVDNIKEILNINRKRNDYLGEYRPLPPPVLHSRGLQRLDFLSGEIPERYHLGPATGCVILCEGSQVSC